jgi:peptide/nickel transport system permease protein
MALALDPTKTSAPEAAAFKPTTPGQLVWRRFLRHKGAVFGAVGAMLVIGFIVVGSLLIKPDQAIRPDPLNILSGPTWLSDKPSKEPHLFGTDQVGRDIFARIVYGGQISLAIAVLALTLGTLVGIVVGGISGYFGGWVDVVLMRFTEAMLSIPQLFLLIVLGKLLVPKLPSTLPFLGRNISGSVIVVILVIGFTSWMYGARIVRASILSLRERDYVAASQALGANRFRVLFRHLIPNTFAPIIVTATLGLVNAITTEAYVSFLGLGVQDPPTASWGNMISQSLNHMQKTPPVWWMWFFPGAFITLTVLFINFVGDGLRDALDPRRKV